MRVSLLRHTPEPDLLAYIAGRQCYSTKPAYEIEDEFRNMDKDEANQTIGKFITERLKEGHTSILDHIMFTFHIEGISRTTEIQLVRARIGTGFSIQSGRYTNAGNANFYVPEIFNKIGMTEEYISILEKEKEFYKKAVEKATEYYMGFGYGKAECEKIAQEDARYVFSQSLLTQAVCSMDGTALLHFLKLRTCRHAQTEIRAVANVMHRMALQVAPGIFNRPIIDCPNCHQKCPIIKLVANAE